MKMEISTVTDNKTGVGYYEIGPAKISYSAFGNLSIDRSFKLALLIQDELEKSAPSASAPKFAVGDVVRLIGQTKKMIVEGIACATATELARAKCVWHDETGRPWECYYLLSVLEDAREKEYSGTIHY